MPETERQDLRAQVIRENPFMTYNHIEVGPIGPDCAEVSLPGFPGKAPTSIMWFMAGHSCPWRTAVPVFCARTDGRDYVTQDASVQFIHNVGEGTVTARGKVLNRGRRICLVNVSIRSEKDILLFYGTFTMYCVDS